MKLIPLLALAATLACSGDKEPSDDTGDTGDTEVELAPEDGDYLAHLVAFTLDECELEAGDWATVLEDPIGMAFVREGANLSLTIINDGEPESDVIDCTAMGDHFMCKLAAESTDMGGETREAVVSQSMGAMIGWETNTDIAGSVDFNLDCVGADCEEVIGETNFPKAPCQTSLSIAGSKTE
jgi:hypothetical protein